MAASTYDITSTISSRYGTYNGWEFGGAWTTYNNTSGNNDANRFYIGPVNSYNCRAVLRFTTPNVSNIKKIVIGVKADSAITPLYTRGYLNSTLLDPNTANWSGTLSYYYTDAAATTRFTSYQSSPSMGYFVFSGTFSANTTYYCHIATWASDSAALDSNTSSGFIRSRNMSGYVQAYVEYYPTYAQNYFPNSASGSQVTEYKTHDTAYKLLSSKPSSWTKANSVNNYTVVLNGNGGKSAASKTSTRTITYTLGGWLDGSTSGTKRALGYSYTSNAAHNWYASWSGTESWNSFTLGTTSRDSSKANGYTVSFNKNGGTTTPGSLTATNTTTYTFKNWNSSQDGSGTSYNSSSTYTFKATSTTNLYAQWNSSTTKGSITLPAAISRSDDTAIYTVNFEENFTGGGMFSQSSIKTTKYTFAGWNTNSSGTGSNYSASSTYTPSSSHTLYAKWSSSTSQNSITLPSLTRNGYALVGWATSPTATNPTYSVGATITPKESMTLYAIWGATTQTYIYHDGQWRRALKYVWNIGSASNLLDESLLDIMEIF